jgi:hypothetical protein
MDFRHFCADAIAGGIFLPYTIVVYPTLCQIASSSSGNSELDARR